MTTTLGQRISAARNRRRLTQEELAEAAGISIGALRKLEQGQRLSARLDTITALAGALDVPVSDLHGVQPGLTDHPYADVASLRAAIYDRSADADPPNLDLLRQQVLELRALYWRAKYGALAQAVPRHLGHARSAVRAAVGDEQRRTAQALLAESLQIAASLVTQLAHEDLGHVALMQATEAASASDDPLLVAAQHSATAWILSRQGLWQQAQLLATAAAQEVEPILSRAPVDQIGMWGELLHFGMVALAREGRQTEAHELLSLVQAAGQAIGSRTPTKYKIPFSATWAQHSAVQLAQSTDQPEKALRAAARVDSLESLPPATQARFLLNKAWAATLLWQSEDALDALRRIEEIAPELLDHHGLARSIVEELMPRRRKQRLRGLKTLAERMGVADE